MHCNGIMHRGGAGRRLARLFLRYDWEDRRRTMKKIFLILAVAVALEARVGFLRLQPCPKRRRFEEIE